MNKKKIFITTFDRKKKSSYHPDDYEYERLIELLNTRNVKISSLERAAKIPRNTLMNVRSNGRPIKKAYYDSVNHVLCDLLLLSPREVLKTKIINQAKLAEFIGIDKMYISKYINYDKEFAPEIEVLFKEFVKSSQLW